MSQCDARSASCWRRPDERLALQPQVGLERLGDLVAALAADGLAVTVSGGELATTLPVSVSTAAYRVLQEALSNVRRHAARRAEVRASVGDDGAVRAEVADDGGGAARW